MDPGGTVSTSFLILFITLFMLIIMLEVILQVIIDLSSLRDKLLFLLSSTKIESQGGRQKTAL